MCRVCVFAIVLLLPAVVNAQQADQALEASIGPAFSFSVLGNDKDTDVSGDGFVVRAEYSYAASSFFAWKPYAALLMTWQGTEDRERDPRCVRAAVECEATSQVVLLGSKLRLAAPIPWIAPFIELGLGLAAGISRTESFGTDHSNSGVSFTLPLALGLALGPKHSVELAILYYEHFAAKQVLGGLTLGLRIPIEDG